MLIEELVLVGRSSLDNHLRLELGRTVDCASNRPGNWQRRTRGNG